MCEKCDKLLGDPKTLIKITDTGAFLGFVNAMLPMVTTLQDRVHKVGLENRRPIHPCTDAAVFGWIYYTTMLNAVHDGIFTEGEFIDFDNLLYLDTKQGVAEAAAIKGKASSFDDLPDEIKGMVRGIIGGILN